MWVKRKFVLWAPRHDNLLIEKSNNIYVFETLSVSKTHCYCQSQGIFFKQHLQMVYFWRILQGQMRFYSWRANQVKESFKTFLIEHYARNIGNKNIDGMLMSPTLYFAGKFKQGVTSIIPWFI